MKEEYWREYPSASFDKLDEKGVKVEYGDQRFTINL